MAQEEIAAAESPRFEIGAVLGSSITVFFRNIVPFGIITALIGIPYILLTVWGNASAADLSTAMQQGTLGSGIYAAIAVAAIVFMLTNALTQSVIIYGTFQDLRGQQAPIGDCLSRGFSAMPKVVIGAILASIGLMIGFFLLFVPGVILLLMWWVYIPVIVVEAAGITQSFGRSRALTRGHRWGILGLLVIVGIVQTVAGIIVGALGSLLGTTATEVLNLVVTLGFGAFSSVMAAVGYYRLRAEKEGIVIDDLARVFD